jgi:beta-mannosidase
MRMLNRFALLVTFHLALPLAAAAQTGAQEKTLWQPYYVTPRAASNANDAARHIALEGEWQLGWRDAQVGGVEELNGQQKWIRARVPATVQMALHFAGELPHPYYNLNSEKYKWVDEKVWYYKRGFDVAASAKGSSVFLCFDGIDYFARVWLNGKLLGRHEGMFGGPTIEVSDAVNFGGANEVVVEVRAANHGNKGKFNPRAVGKIIKPWVIAGGLGGEMFFPLGLWRGARVEIVPPIHIERPFLVTRRADAREAQLELSLEVFADSHSLKYQLHPWDNRQLDNRSNYQQYPLPVPLKGEPPAVKIELIDATGKVALAESIPLKINEGRNWVKHSLRVVNPKLWWPNGLGEAHLYKVRLSLARQGGELDRIEFDYGIRTLETRPSAGPRTGDRWDDWQFVVNSQPFFVKGVNWMPADILLDLPRERYEWLLGLAKASGIQLLRVWGGGGIETEEFYSVCNRLGLMVWQDFPVGNQDTPDWPQDVWEAQVAQTIFRLRNHPSLAVYCGGNEFNPYSFGNAATIGILERSLATFDPTRPFRRTSPDGGSIHTYPDMDPTWFAKLYSRVPYIAEAGMHNLPEPEAIREVVNAEELKGPFSNLFTDAFVKAHPDFIHHFVEYQPSRVPRMLSRASHVDDMSAPSLESLSEATQVGAGEFYQIISEGAQANYPVTTGLMPWVFKRPWPVVAIMLVDAFGQPNAPYYFLKRTYEPTHVSVKLPHLIWAAGERVPVEVSVTHSRPTAVSGLKAAVTIYDDAFQKLWREERAMSLPPGASVAGQSLGEFTIPNNYTDRFFFVVAELRQVDGALVSRAVYWPRSLTQMSDASFREQYRATPQPSLTLDRGPWLKRRVAAVPTTLSLKVEAQEKAGSDRSRLKVRVRNAGGAPAFMTRLNVEGVRRAFHATDNFFWLAPGEERLIEIEVLWREAARAAQAVLTAESWNAPAQKVALQGL